MRKLFISIILLLVFIGLPILFIMSAPLEPPYYLDIYHRDPLPPGTVSIATITNLTEARSWWKHHEDELNKENIEMRKLKQDVGIIKLGMSGDKKTLQKIVDGLTTAVAAYIDKSRATAVATTVLTILRSPGSQYNLKVELINKYLEIQDQQEYVDKADSYRDEFYDCFVLFWNAQNSPSNLPPEKTYTPEQGGIPEEVSLKCARCWVTFSTPTYSLSSLVHESKNNHKRICGQGATGEAGNAAPGHEYYSCRPGNHNQWIDDCQVIGHTTQGYVVCGAPDGYWLCLPHIHSFVGTEFKITEGDEVTVSASLSPSGGSYTASAGDTHTASVSVPSGFNYVYWYIAGPGESGLGTNVETDTGTGSTTSATLSYTFSSSASGDYVITAYTYLSDNSVVQPSYTVSVSSSSTSTTDTTPTDNTPNCMDCTSDCSSPCSCTNSGTCGGTPSTPENNDDDDGNDNMESCPNCLALYDGDDSAAVEQHRFITCNTCNISAYRCEFTQGICTNCGGTDWY